MAKSNKFKAISALMHEERERAERAQLEANEAFAKAEAYELILMKFLKKKCSCEVKTVPNGRRVIQHKCLRSAPEIWLEVVS